MNNRKWHWGRCRGWFLALSAVAAALPAAGCHPAVIALLCTHGKGVSETFPLMYPQPVFPSETQILEQTLDAKERDKVPILDPIQGEGAPHFCMDPPSEREVYRALPKFTHGLPPYYEVQRNNVRIIVDKIGDKIDPCRFYPLIGPAQLHHCHYKATVYFDETQWSDKPIPFNYTDHRVQVLYLDHDHLHRCGGPAHPDP